MVPKKILYCTDFSENSEPARQLAIDYAQAFGAQLIMVHVVDSAAFETYAEWGAGGFGQIVSGTHELAEARLEAMGNECSELVKEVKTICKVGSPAKEIVALAQGESVDLIVTGTHGRTGFTGLVMGSIARSILKQAHRPVLIVSTPPSENVPETASELSGA
jgi:nucleotide-binding universal stress UspA family protein